MRGCTGVAMREDTPVSVLVLADVLFFLTDGSRSLK